MDSIAVNLDTAAHSRYANYLFNGFFTLNGVDYGTNASGVFRLEGDLDYEGAAAEAAVNAHILTPAPDFDLPVQKVCADLTVGARGAALALDLAVDEILVAEDLPFRAVSAAGVHRQRCRLPRGAKGTNWQYRVKNVAGARFTIFDLKVPFAASQRSM